MYKCKMLKVKELRVLRENRKFLAWLVRRDMQ